MAGYCSSSVIFTRVYGPRRSEGKLIFFSCATHRVENRHLAHSGSQSQGKIWCIFPAHSASRSQSNINNGNKCRPIQSVIIRVINQEYDYRHNWTKQCPVTNYS